MVGVMKTNVIEMPVREQFSGCDLLDGRVQIRSLGVISRADHTKLADELRALALILMNELGHK